MTTYQNHTTLKVSELKVTDHTIGEEDAAGRRSKFICLTQRKDAFRKQQRTPTNSMCQEGRLVDTTAAFLACALLSNANDWPPDGRCTAE